MGVRFAILAHYTFTFLSTFHSSSIAFAIIFATLRLLASASPLRHKGRNTFECSRVPEVGQLLSFVDVKPAFFLVATIVALASLIADPTLGEALTVHLQAVYFGALAARVRVLSRREVHVRNGAEDVLIIGKFVGLFDELVEKILIRAKLICPLFELLLRDEFE